VSAQISKTHDQKEESMPEVISIITPSLNQRQYIEQTIQSVLTQKGDFFIDYQIIDGESTDGSLEVIRKYEREIKAHSSIENQNGLSFYKGHGGGSYGNRCRGISYRWHSERDGGQSAALNRGFQNAAGNVVGWINSDDYYLEGVFDAFMRRFAPGDIDVVLGNTTAMDHLGRIMWQQMPTLPTWFTLIYLRDAPPQPAVFFTRRLLNRVGGVDESLHYGMDTDLWCRFLAAGARFAKIKRMCAVQTYHPASKSCQGKRLFEKFEPDSIKIRNHYRKGLGYRHYFFELLLLLNKVYHMLPARKRGQWPADTNFWRLPSSVWLNAVVQGRHTEAI
jgi:glycosyltransferase involved in cell wall biosynthesis